MNITQIRSATIIVDYNNTKFLIDPWLGPKNYMAGFEAAINSEIRQPRVDLPCPIEKIVDVDAVIITHIHPDHWDEYAEEALDKNIKIFVQADDDKVYLTDKGFNNIEVLTQVGTCFHNICLYKTLGQHGTREIMEPLFQQIGMCYNAMGVVFKAPNEKTLYLAGDTIWCQEVVNALHEHKPEIAVVNACGATVLNGERLIMKEPDIAEFIKAAPQTTIIASHMDTVSHLSITRADLKEYLLENNITNVLIPEDGETLSFIKK